VHVLTQVLNDTTNRPAVRPAHPPLSRASSSWISTTASRASSAPHSPISPDVMRSTSTNNLRCSIEVWSLSQGMAARVNSLKVYSDLHRMFLQLGSPYLTSPSSPTEYIDPKAQVSADSIIGASTRIGERTNIKQSIVGRHCVIGKQVRILGSVVMDHTVIEDGAKIEGCIIGRSTRVGHKAELVKSITQHGYEVEAGATIKGEKLETMDWDPNAEESDESE